MAQWKETLEPYVKVTERVRTAALNPTAGEDLIIGVTLISDAGPAVPTLISSQSEFIKTFASKDLTEDYVKSLDKLYTGDNNTLASTMWLNGYRLAGSNTLLVCRASKASDLYFAKPLVKGDQGVYLLRDGELLKKVSAGTGDNRGIKFVIDVDKDDASHDQDGWSISINGVGVFGNRTTDEGPQYDYYVGDLPELVEQLNETSKFFSPDYTFYSDDKGTQPVGPGEEARSVIFRELYVGHELLDTSDSRCPGGKQFLIICEPDWTSDNPSQKIIEINSSAFSGFSAPDWYATNVYNSSTELKIRIRRFNHDAVVAKELSSVSIAEAGASPWMVLGSVLDTFTNKGQKEPSQSVLDKDFYEVCVLDPSLSAEPQFFNLGKVLGRGDMEASELNDMLSMIQLNLPDDLRELGLNYYGYTTDDNIWKEIPASEGQGNETKSVASYQDLLAETGMTIGDIVKVGSADPVAYYQYSKNGEDQVYADLSIDPSKYSILNISDSDLTKALDELGRDEVYVTEGLCDLGNTNPAFQNYMANMAINENYFYPISTINSTNYMTIANSAAKISQDSYKLYMAAPWDIDTGTAGFKYYASPAVIYWESVARNRRNNNEFAGVFGQSNGVVQYQRPVTEFNKKFRQLLLSKKVNTVLWNNQTSAWNFNDNYTKQSVDNIMSDEGNSRLAIRISKAMPVILKQFIGWKISPRLWATAKSTIDYWFKSTILPLNFGIDAYEIIIDETNNPDEVIRANKMIVQILVRYQNSLKYIEVYHDALTVGMSMTALPE